MEPEPKNVKTYQLKLLFLRIFEYKIFKIYSTEIVQWNENYISKENKTKRYFFRNALGTSAHYQIEEDNNSQLPLG